MADPETLAVYARRATDYADRFEMKEDNAHVAAFLAALPDGARVLDLGCGTGNASALMAAAGCDVDAWDASPEMVAIARERFGVDAEVRGFETLGATDRYDGIWANFSLLHAPKADMAGHLARIARALTTAGVFHIGLKMGSGERRDDIGRFYAFYEADELAALLAEAGFAVTARTFGEEPGLDGVVAPFMILLTEKMS